MSARQFTVVVAGLVTLFLTGRPAAAQKKPLVPEVGYPLQFTVSPPVREMPPQAHGSEHPREVQIRHPHARPQGGNVTDTVVQDSTPVPAAAQSLGNFEGLGAGYPGFAVTAVPPDPNGAVGPNHYVQWVNNAFVIFNKQGAQVQAPISDNTFWSYFSTCNQLGGFSDPIVQYDRAADRWLVGEVALPLFPGLFGQYAQCFAVSTTSDPTGPYYLWAYGFGTSINDYPKIAVWPDAYYVTWNIFQNGSNFIGPKACAFDRNAMLSGAAAPARVCFQLPTAFDSLLPSDLDGATAPPAGSPNFLMNVDTAASALNLWKFHVDFTTPNQSTFTGPTSIPGVAAFTAPCTNTPDCVPQPGTTMSLDSLGDRLMYRLAYRNFGDHESIVANHTVVAPNGNTGVRWYEIRDPNGAPTVYQQGSFAPDSDYRWMASIAMDQSGNIAVGYSVSSSATYPSIRYTGWEVGDTPGTLQAETSLVAGGGSQTGYDRWGDYSAMRIDPIDDCTFWYTQEYQATTQTANWSTRIGSFKFSSCGQSLTSTTTAVTSSLNPSMYGTSVSFTATVTPSSGPTGSVTFKDGNTVLGTQPLNASGQASFQTSSFAVSSHSITAVYGGDATFSGSTSAVLTQKVDKADTTTTVASNNNPSAFGQNVTFTATVSPSGTTGTPGGSVTFKDGATTLGSSPLSSGVATFATASLAVGPHSITAVYGADTNFNGSTSAALTETVNKANTATAVASNNNPSVFGQNVTLSATVSPSGATGTVQFFDGATLLGAPTLSGGTATLSTASLSAGTHSITATYSGDGNYATSSSTALSQVVNPPNTTTTLTSSANPSKPNQRVTFTAMVSPSGATGTVTFLDGSTSLGTGTLSGGIASLSTSSLSLGTHFIRAQYSGDSSYAGSTSTVLTQTVQRKK